MAHIGFISREPNPPGVDLAHWRRIIASDERLTRPPPRDIVNPFTRKPEVHVPADTDATIAIDGLPVGAITASDRDDGELDVWGNGSRDDDVENLAREIAKALGGQYTSFG
jgi:hypothetical protein